jgi:hypothetical protein
MVSTKTKAKVQPKSSEELVEMFDAGEDVSDYIDADRVIKRVNVDFPAWIVAELDKVADNLAVPRQAIIKIWIAERLKAEKEERSHG